MQWKNIKTAVVAAFVALGLMLPTEGSLGQVVTQLPVYIDGSTSGGAAAPTDLGNGPIEIRILQGNLLLFTSQGAGVGSTSGSSTALTLTAVPTIAPCVGCIISGTGITSGTTVSAYNGVTSITLSAAMTVAASTPVAWGAACPSSTAGQRVIPLQPGQPSAADIPLYTQARICAGAQNTPGATVIPFAIGAH